MLMSNSIIYALLILRRAAFPPKQVHKMEFVTGERTILACRDRSQAAISVRAMSNKRSYSGKSRHTGPPMTFGNAAAARVRLVVACLA
jgi:hypothetical protein